MKSQLTSPDTIDAYIASFPAHVQAILQQIRTTIAKAAPHAEERMKYRIPTFVLHENLVHFAAFKRHIGFYPGPSGITQFARELSTYKSAKGSVQFPLDAPIPFNLIARVVRFRVKEVGGKVPVKTKRT